MVRNCFCFRGTLTDMSLSDIAISSSRRIWSRSELQCQFDIVPAPLLPGLFVVVGARSPRGQSTHQVSVLCFLLTYVLTSPEDLGEGHGPWLSGRRPIRHVLSVEILS